MLWRWWHLSHAERVAVVVLRASHGSLSRSLFRSLLPWALSLLLAFQRRGWRSECQQHLPVLPAPRPAWGVADAAHTLAEGARGFAQDHPAQKRQSCLRARRSGSSVDSYAAVAPSLTLPLKPCKCPGSWSCPITGHERGQPPEFPC